MIKSLTEKWKDGELDGGYYYLIMEDETLRIDHTDYKFWSKTICWEHTDEHFVKEVLAPVPSYKELTLMAGNYRLAKKALRDCYNEMKYWATMNHRCSKIFNHIKEALVEIEEEV